MRVSLNNITIKKADIHELQQVKRFYREHKMRPQAAKRDDVYIATLNNKVIGALRLCLYDDAWLLRSMCVQTRLRGQGIGKYMLDCIRDILSEKQCYSFPYQHLEHFYQQAGFKIISAEEAPESIAEKYNDYLMNGRKILLMQHKIKQF